MGNRWALALAGRALVCFFVSIGFVDINACTLVIEVVLMPFISM